MTLHQIFPSHFLTPVAFLSVKDRHVYNMLLYIAELKKRDLF